MSAAAGERAAAPSVEASLVYRLTRLSVRLWLLLFDRLRVEGREHLPERGGVLLVANHASFLDIPIVAAATRRHVAFVARDSLARARWLGWLMRQCGAVLVKRGGGDRTAIRTMVERLDLGDCVAIFPEGTRSRDGRVAAFRGGALLVARSGRVPIVPVGIEGAFRVWPRHRRLPRWGPIRVRFGEPLDPREPDALARARAAVVALSRGTAAPEGGAGERAAEGAAPAERA